MYLYEVQSQKRDATSQKSLQNPAGTQASPTPAGSNSAEAAPLACVGVGLVQEVRARVHVGERPDAQAVDGMKLGFQKLTARLLHVL